VDGKAVLLYLLPRQAELGRQVGTGNDNLQFQVRIVQDFLHQRAEQTVFRPRGRYDGDFSDHSLTFSWKGRHHG
jgi:hypothetical protein